MIVGHPLFVLFHIEFAEVSMENVDALAQLYSGWPPYPPRH
jgi:hypothetical protein